MIVRPGTVLAAARELRRPPPWIYPPENFEPFRLTGDAFNTVLNAETELLTFVTGNRWLRIATMELSEGQHPNNYLRMVGPGWGMLAEFIPFGGISGSTGPLEFPVFALLPPSSQHSAIFQGQAITSLILRLVGWYF